MVTTFHTSPKLLEQRDERRNNPFHRTHSNIQHVLFIRSSVRPCVCPSVRAFSSLFVSHFAPLFNADPALASAVPVVQERRVAWTRVASSTSKAFFSTFVALKACPHVLRAAQTMFPAAFEAPTAPLAQIVSEAPAVVPAGKTNFMNSPSAVLSIAHPLKSSGCPVLFWTVTYLPSVAVSTIAA